MKCWIGEVSNDQLSATLTKLLDEQRKIQSQLQEDMRSQENQFKQQMAKIAEQQRRLIERDALKDIIHQQQQILNQQMLNASAGTCFQLKFPRRAFDCSQTNNYLATY